MYTEENMSYNSYDENYEENNYNDNKGSSIWSLLLRILIIFLCLLLVIWIISKFVGGKKVKNDGVVFEENVTAVQYASEKYFFLQNNLPKENESITISLKEMNDKGLIQEVKDYKNNTCSTDVNESFATLKKTDFAYVLTLKLTCNEENKEEVIYYDLKTGECLSCGGITYMDGSSLVIGSEETEKDETENDQEFENDNIDVEENKELEKLNINCNEWSDWTDINLNNDKLLVRTKKLYKGTKTTTAGFEPVYGEWSDYTETPIPQLEGLEVEIKEEVKEVWSEEKTTTDYITNSDTIKVITATTTNGSSSCNTVTKQVRAKLSASEYANYNSKGLIVAVHDTYYNMDCDDDCNTCYKKVYDVTYKKQTKSCSNSTPVTTYTYQELTQSPVTLYRYRTVAKQEVKGETITTDWVEKLEDGYTKTDEKIVYSYKDTVCKG